MVRRKTQLLVDFDLSLRNFGRELLVPHGMIMSSSTYLEWFLSGKPLRVCSGPSL